jgi:hypothetical protein
VWYTGLTVAVPAFAYRDHGIQRSSGALVIVAYLVFAASIASYASGGPQQARLAGLASLAVAAAFAAWLVFGRLPSTSRTEPAPSAPEPARRGVGGRAEGTPVAVSGNGSDPDSARARIAIPSQTTMRRDSLLPGWPVNRLWALGLAISVTVAAIDAGLGSRAVLIGLLIAGPCCVLLTGRWAPTALTGMWVISLAVALGVPDGIWGTGVFFTWLTAVTVVALASTAAAALIQAGGPARRVAHTAVSNYCMWQDLPSAPSPSSGRGQASPRHEGGAGMRQFRFRALVTLDPPAPGTQATEYPSGTHKLMVHARCINEPSRGRYFPAVITRDDEQPLQPDRQAVVTITVADDDAPFYLATGEPFTLWGTGHGHGIITRRVFTASGPS